MEEVNLDILLKIEFTGIDEQSEAMNCKEIRLNYAASSIYKEDGHCVAKIPWKENSPCSSTNYEIVKRRTESVIHCLARDLKLLKIYNEII